VSVSDAAVATVFDVLATAGKAAIRVLFSGKSADDALLEAISTIETERAIRGGKFEGLREKTD
jgi:isoaspartyl peptidase/L-asparaginase-like protein (Ntn-hydrolase superfamily)